MTDLLFNGRYAFHHKDGAQCPWLSFSPQTDALFLYFVLQSMRNTDYRTRAPGRADSDAGRLGETIVKPHTPFQRPDSPHRDVMGVHTNRISKGEERWKLELLLV